MGRWEGDQLFGIRSPAKYRVGAAADAFFLGGVCDSICPC
jgi:hypothetical protein